MEKKNNNIFAKPLVSVIIVNWNALRFIQNCLDSVLNQTYRNIEIIFIDNFSIDGSLQFVQKKYKSIKIIKNSKNLGYCAGHNIGIQQSFAKYVMLLNPDVVLKNDCVQHFVAVMDGNERYGSASGKILRLEPDNCQRVQIIDSTGLYLTKNGRAQDRDYGRKESEAMNNSELIFATCGAAPFYRRRMLNDVKINDQYLDEDYFAYYEDLDMGWRAQLFGWKCVYEPKSQIYHYRGKYEDDKRRYLKFNFFNKSSKIKYHILKNRYLTLIKNSSFNFLLKFSIHVLIFETLIWSYALLFDRKLFKAPYYVFANLKVIIKKRKLIQSRRIKNFSEIDYVL